MAIPLVALQGDPVSAGNAFLSGRERGQAMRANDLAMSEAEDVKRKQSYAAVINAIGYVKGGATPQDQQARLNRVKQWAAAHWPDSAQNLNSITIDMLEPIAAALTNPEDAAKVDLLKAQIGHVGAQTYNTYNMAENRDRATTSGINVDNAQIGNYGASTANYRDQIRSRQGQDQATVYGQLPEGQIYDPQTGRAGLIPGVMPPFSKSGGNVTVDPVTGALTVQAGKDPTEGQSKDMAWLVRARAAEKNINPDYVPSYWDERADANLPFGAGNQFTGEEYRQQRQAWTDWVMAILRKDTGAAISNAEWDYAFRTWLPQANDTPMILAQKAAARQTATNAIETGLPPRLRPAGSGIMAPGNGPQPGQIEDGYRFKGGNPADPNSWEPAN